MDIHAPTQGVNLTANASPGTLPGALLMTCRVLSCGPDCFSIQVRALLDSASPFPSYLNVWHRLYVSSDPIKMPEFMGLLVFLMALIISHLLIWSFLPCRDSLKRLT